MLWDVFGITTLFKAINSSLAYVNNIAQSSTEPRLCEVCCNFDKKRLDLVTPTGRPNLAQLKAASNGGCECCKILDKAIKEFKLVDYFLDGELAASPGHDCYTDSDGIRRAYIHVDLLRVNITPKEVPKLQSDQTPWLHPQLLVSLWGGNKGYESDSVWLYSDSEHKLFSALGSVLHVQRFSNSQECQLAMQHWINDCNQNHDMCKRGPSTYLPKRVIDVGNGQVRLLECEEVKGHYIALSHCWGSSRMHIKTTKETLARWSVNIPESELCNTYKDVILLARSFGISYLWIDSLCIVQDDPEEWEAESGRMALIYENAYLTICATRSTDGDGGLFSDRGVDPILLGHLSSHDSKSEEQGIKVYGRAALPNHQDGGSGNEYSVSSEPLMRRAWAFQERLLSTRILDFLSQEIVWECKYLQRCECTQAERLKAVENRSERRNLTMMKLSIPNGPASDNLSERFPFSGNSWETIVKAYTKLDLTYSTDKLPALSGLAQKAVQNATSETRQHLHYIAGLWAHELPRQLLWYTSNAERRPEFIAPSFSWASVKGQIDFFRVPGNASNSASILRVEYLPSGTDPYGLCHSGKLTIQGPVTRVKIFEQKAGWSNEAWLEAHDDTRWLWLPDERLDKDSKYLNSRDLEFFSLEIARVEPEVYKFRFTVWELGTVYGLIMAYDPKSDLYSRIGCWQDNTYKGKTAEYMGLSSSSQSRTVVLV